MYQARIAALPERKARHEDTLPQDENPAQAFAIGILLAVPLWGLIGVVLWAII